MASTEIDPNEVVTDPVVLDGTGDSLEVAGRLDTGDQDPAVLAQGAFTSVEVEDPDGAIVANGTAIRVEGEVASIENEGVIDGGFNGIDIANGTNASAIIENEGLITSESRAVNIGGFGARLENSGRIETTADPRNGTVYGDITANSIVIENEEEGVIDVGEGNNGDAISLELGPEVSGSIENEGLIQGRGEALGNNQAAAIRLYSGPDQPEDQPSVFTGDIVNEDTGTLAAETGAAVIIEENTTLDGDIVNDGLIESANSANGTGVRFEAGSDLTGALVNEEDGTISGGFNGIDVGNGGDGSFTIENEGLITSESRAINLGADENTLINSGEIVTTADPRNGTVYGDITANNIVIENEEEGVIDVGEGNNGDAISLELGPEVSGSIENEGLIQGRGEALGNNQAAAIRLYSGPDQPEDQPSVFTGDIVNEDTGTLAAETGPAVVIEENTTLDGDIVNDGLIESANSANGTGVRFEAGSDLTGALVNEEDGTISGGFNGIDVGNGGDGSFTIENEGLITSESRAINLGADENTLINSGEIVTTADPRNGTVYGDITANNIVIENEEEGVIDVGEGNNGDAISLELGPEVSGSIVNEGLIQGRGEALGNNQAAAIRLYSGPDQPEDQPSVFTGDIVNEDTGTLAAETGAAIIIEEDTTLDGDIVNDGLIIGGVDDSESGSGQLAIDASESDGPINVVNTGSILGDVVLSGQDDTFDGADGSVQSVVAGGGGNDLLIGGADADELQGNAGDDTLQGGRGEDTLDGGSGVDTADFSDSAVGVVADVGSGTAEANVGFTFTVDDGPFADLTGQNATPEELLQVLSDGGAYFNVHTSNFPSGELRGQLELDPATAGQPVVRFVADLEGGQEVPPVSTPASGSAVLTVDTVNNTYDVSITTEDLDPNTLIDVGGSPIHVHLAPAGVNGPIGLNAGLDSADGPVAVVEQDQLIDIENLVGSNNDDELTGDAGNNELSGLGGDDLLAGGGGADTLLGGEGNDTIRGGGGEDVTDGGAGIDTNDFSDIGAPVVASLAAGQASYQPAPGVTIVEQVLNFENLTGSANDDQLFGDGNANVLDGGDGNDLLAGGGGADTLLGGQGDDVLRGGGGNDVTDGGEGSDTADFSDIGSSVTADLASGTATYQGPNGSVADTLVNIENLTGSSNDDVLSGDAGNNVIGGGLGNDVLLGGDGDDVLRGDEIDDGTAVVVTVENLLPEGGTFLTPVWFGFHDGANFDLFDVGGAASQGLERLAEDGVVAPISAEFVAQTTATGGVDSTIFGTQGVPGPIDPGETAQAILSIDDPSNNRFFTWATMIIPSNDAFLAAPDNPQADAIFDEFGNFIGLEIVRTGDDVLDAGTEVNNELGAAFLNQTALDQGTPEGGTVQAHPGFNGSVGNPDATPVNVLGGTTAAGTVVDPAVADFTQDPAQELLRIRVDLLANQGGNDVIDGGGGNDRIDGGGGNDTLLGGIGDDTLQGGSGNDILIGGIGNDTADFSDSTVGVVADVGSGTAEANVGFTFTVDEGPFADLTGQNATPEELLQVLTDGGAYFNVHTSNFPSGELRGQLELDPATAGQPVVRFVADLEGGQEVPPVSTPAGGTAVLTVDTVNNTYDVSITTEDLDPNTLIDVGGSPIHVHLAPAGVNGPIGLNAGLDSADGPIAVVEQDQLIDIENLVGSNNDDELTGDAGNNELSGLDGDDLLAGGGGADTLLGGEGNDTIRGGGGEDVTDGGAGIDTNDFSDIGAPVVASLAAGQASYQPAPGVTIVEQVLNFENLTGSANNDQLFGDGNANVLDGGDGNDLLAGGGGADTLLGGEGDDVLRGGGGNDVTDGGEGSDTADFSDIGSSVTADLASGTATYQGPNGAVADTLVNIENLTGSSNDDVLSGDAGNNVIGGGLGNDVLLGGDGDDVLRGDEIDDGTAVVVTVENLLPEGGTFLTPVWFGFHDGANFDLFDVGGAASQGLERLAEDGVVAPISAEFVAQTTATGGVDSTIFGTQGAPGPIDPGETAQAILSIDNPSNNRFFTWATMIIPSNDAFLAAPDNPQADAIFDEFGNFIGLEIVRTGDDVLDAGTEVNNELGAAFLNQTALDQGTPEGGTVQAHPGFNGSVGNPDATPVNVLGGTTAAGTVVDPAVADFTQDPAQELLRIRVDLLANQGGNDVIDGGGGNDRIDGGGGNDTLLGGIGDDTLQGGGGNDVLIGGIGNDTADFSDIGAPVTASLVTGLATYQGPNGPVTDSLIAVENLTGSRNDDQLTGDAGSNALSGLSGDDLLVGGGGADTLLGGHGDDTLRGGGGSDVTDGGEGNDTADFSDIGSAVTADLVAETATYQGPNGLVTDSLLSIENLFGSSNDDDLTGDAGNNELSGLGGNDLLAGGGGADTLLGGHGDDTLRGGGGSDVTDGGEGNDTADFSDIGFSVTANLDSGLAIYQGPNGTVTDSLISIENLTGSDNADGLTGDAGDNILLGLGGADFLAGAGGNDLLTGGEGADTFVFAQGDDLDTILDFEVGTDLLDLTGFGFESVDEVADLSVDVGDDTFLDFGGGDQLTLVGFTSTDLSTETVLV